MDLHLFLLSCAKFTELCSGSVQCVHTCVRSCARVFVSTMSLCFATVKLLCRRFSRTVLERSLAAVFDARVSRQVQAKKETEAGVEEGAEAVGGVLLAPGWPTLDEEL